MIYVGIYGKVDDMFVGSLDVLFECLEFVIGFVCCIGIEEMNIVFGWIKGVDGIVVVEIVGLFVVGCCVSSKRGGGK